MPVYSQTQGTADVSDEVYKYPWPRTIRHVRTRAAALCFSVQNRQLYRFAQIRLQNSYAALVSVQPGVNLSGLATVADSPIERLCGVSLRKAARDKDSKSPRFVPARA